MGRKQKKCIKKCQNHLFHLRPFHSMAYISRDVQISFCPQSLQKIPNYPSFNKDKKYYTSSFYLKDQLPMQSKDDVSLKNEHHQFCLDQQKQKSLIYIPKPRSKNSYCYVCKSHYDDYYKHVKSDGHKAYIRRNKFTEHIQALIKQRYPQRSRVMYSQQSEIIQKMTGITSQSSISTLSSVHSQALSQNSIRAQNKLSSFRPFSICGAFEIGNRDSFKPFVSMQLVENKGLSTPEKELKKSEQSIKKSPSSTKINQPIILNSPYIML